MGVKRVKSTTLNAFGPEITRSIARAVSFLIILKKKQTLLHSYKV